MDYRTEEDALGKVEVPKDAYFGSFTTRAQQNFQISGMTAPEEFRKALGYIKLAACRVNRKLKQLPAKEAKAIEQAAKEFIEGRFDHEFSLDVFQAGAGTSYNMNCNEVISNRASEILGGKKGTYSPVHPNNHVNMAQSSNDIIPTATRIALILMYKNFVQELEALIKSFEKKGREFSKIKKVGRTHLQDAVPIMLGDEFKSYADALKISLKECKEGFEGLKKLGIGATATGNGINTVPGYKEGMVTELSKLTGMKLSKASNYFTTNNSMQAFSRLSGALRNLANELHRIMNTLRMMGSGPRAGLHELKLPMVQPGSSIMPAKVNPSIPECMSMICGQVIGADQVVSFAAQGGEFELNWYAPSIMFNMTMSLRIFTNGFKMLREKCIDDVKADKEYIENVFKNSLSTATLLVPELGYKTVAKLVKKSIKHGKSLEETRKDLGV